MDVSPSLLCSGLWLPVNTVLQAESCNISSLDFRVIGSRISEKPIRILQNDAFGTKSLIRGSVSTKSPTW